MTTNAAERGFRSFLESEHARDQAASLSDVTYIAEHHDALLEQYPEKWIAVHDGKVVAVGRDFPELKRKVEESGIVITRTVAVFLTREKHNLVL